MATSTFYDKIVIGEDAAQILVEGLKGQKHPRPVVPEGMKWKEDDELLKLYFTNLKRRSGTKTQS